ncbi:transcriptional regulator FeaR [Marinobacterium sp. YM272]|uniref:transcriptional regulator FeaR n=1 Tax=Marinobacterium sp. YM272 TaxID=3421654 RepID=UPI003D7F8DF8
MSINTDLHQWDHAVREICGDFTTTPNPSAPFIGQIKLKNLGGLGVAHIETNAQRVERRISDRQNDEHCFLILQTQGVMGFDNKHDSEFELHPGEMALMDSALAFDMIPRGLVRQISVHLSRDRLQQSLGRLASFGKISQSSLSGQLLHNMLLQLSFENAPFSASTPDGCALQEAITALLKPALENQDADAAELPLRLLAERYIRRYLNDYRLSPEFLAREMNISKRKLYRAFEHNGESVARYILNLRLKQSRMDLIRTDQEPQTITDIAFKWGFSDVSQYSRAFKRQTGLSPSEYRQSREYRL